MASAGKTSSRSSGATPAREEIGALERLADRVAELEARLRALESAPPPQPPPLPAPEEREGVFGPAIKRSDSSRHRDAVSRALSMLGIVAEPAAPADAQKKLSNSHARAVARMKRLSGLEASEPGEPVPEAAVPAPPAGVVAIAEAAEAPPVEPQAEAAAAVVADPDAAVPLPEIVARGPLPVEFVPFEQEAVDLEGALAVELGAEEPRARLRSILVLAAEVVAIAAILLALPGPAGVLAGVPFVALLAAPLWGTRMLTLRAHARFLTLVLLARCLAPDMLLADALPAWRNARFLAMAFAALPAAVVVARGGVGWHVMALALGAVAGGAVGAESGSPAIGVLSALLVVAVSALVRQHRRG